MINRMFSEVEKLNWGMDAAWKRSEVIADNLANVDTPGFKRSSVSFEEYYKAALKDDSDFRLKKTRETHFDIGSSSEPLIRVQRDESTSMRMDGNNVDPDKEMTDLATTVIYYQSLQSQINSEFQQLSIAITGNR